MVGKPPKWMVKIMENPIKMDDLGGFYHPYFWFNTHIYPLLTLHSMELKKFTNDGAPLVSFCDAQILFQPKEPIADNSPVSPDRHFSKPHVPRIRSEGRYFLCNMKTFFLNLYMYIYCTYNRIF